MSLESIPKDLKSLRACLVCSLIKSIDQFEYDGCENCDDFLEMKGDRDRVLDYTSSSFDGLIALTSPDESWVAKWQRIDKMFKGMYAISVTGELPEGVIRVLAGKGIKYRSRNTSTK